MENLPLTAFDVAVLLIIGVSAVLSLVRGATREALGLAAWGGALVVAFYGFSYVREIAQKTIDMPWVADGVALVVVFAVPLIAFKTVASVISEHVSEGGLGMADRFVGLVFGAVRGAVVACALYVGFEILVAPDERPGWVEQAMLLPYVEQGAAVIQDFLPEDAEEEGRRVVDEARREVVRELTTP
ncbi:MAG: CvpA family protein [Pseudomonadota bacterium]